MLFEDNNVLAEKKSLLLAELGSSAATVTNIIPNLESIIGKQGFVPLAGVTPTELQNTLQRFVVALLRILSGNLPGSLFFAYF